MPASNIAKILAKIIKMYRASYVTAAGISGSGGIKPIITKAIMNAKIFQPKIGAFAGKMDSNTILKLIRENKIKF